MKPSFPLILDTGLRLVEIAATGLVLACLLLLLVAGVEPTAAVVPVVPAPVAPVVPVVPAPVVPVAPRLTVAQLRQMARAAGLPRSLYRSGNRAQLLNALGRE